MVFEYQLEREILFRSQGHSAITLLYKKGSRCDPDNFRPIALVFVDVKVVLKVVAHRLQRFLQKLIHQDQEAFVRGRSMHHHIRHLTDIQDLVTHGGEEAYATFLDFEKAYDRVNWTYMFRVLEKMGVGKSFIDWVRLLYNNTKAQLMINGNITPSITPQRGVKQGDPLSALLFLMTIEPLGNLLRQHEEHGIGINGTTVAIGLFFADDSTLLSETPNGVLTLLDFVQFYCNGYGAKLNLSKSSFLSLNRTMPCP